MYRCESPLQGSVSAIPYYPRARCGGYSKSRDFLPLGANAREAMRITTLSQDISKGDTKGRIAHAELLKN